MPRRADIFSRFWRVQALSEAQRAIAKELFTSVNYGQEHGQIRCVFRRRDALPQNGQIMVVSQAGFQFLQPSLARS